MQEAWWERPTCILCDWWWLFLLMLLLGLTAWFTRHLWLPSPPPDPTPTVEILPTLAQPTATHPPTAEPSPTLTQVAQLGTGDIQVTLIWNTVDDLDLWVIDPNGEQIFFAHDQSVSGGMLDVDANPACQNLTTQPVENIFWPPESAPRGTYHVLVNYYQQCGSDTSIPFTVRVLVDGNQTVYQGILVNVQDTQEITTIQR